MVERAMPRLGHTPDDVYADSLSLKEVEERHIRRVLRRHDGNATRAAETLGISRATLWRKLKRMDHASD
jgi:transcriptional regulator with PAS, ATPase and Fis domain